MARKIRSLISSDCILDKDIGLIKIIQYHYRNHSDIFKDEFLDDYVLEKQQYLEYNRTNINPLSVVVKDQYIDVIDSLYTQFKEQEMGRIISFSCNTLMIDVLKLIILGDTPMEVTILCNTQYEADTLVKRLNSFGIHSVRMLVEPDHNKVDLGQYDDIYVKYISDLDSFKKIEKKSIYISTHRLNIICDENNPSNIAPNLDALKYMVDNIVNLISLYRFDEKLIAD